MLAGCTVQRARRPVCSAARAVSQQAGQPAHEPACAQHAVQGFPRQVSFRMDFPGPAIEAIAFHLSADSVGPDPRRTVLPLINRAWRRALQLMPWEQVSICTADLFPATAAANTSTTSDASCTSTVLPADSRRLCCWFAVRKGQVRQLRIKLEWSPDLCTRDVLRSALISVLSSCATHLESLALSVAGTPLLASRLWHGLAAAQAPAGSRLRELDLVVDGNPGHSQALQTQNACCALLMASLYTRLERLTFSVRGIKLLRLPPILDRMASLRSLELRFDPQMLTLPLPAHQLGRLPSSLRRLTLEHPPVTEEAALELASKLPQLQSFLLVQ